MVARYRDLDRGITVQAYQVPDGAAEIHRNEGEDYDDKAFPGDWVIQTTTGHFIEVIDDESFQMDYERIGE